MKYIIISALLIGLLFTQCKREQTDPVITDPTSIYDLKIPEGFNFKTSKKVQVQFSDFKLKSTNKIKYDIYMYDDDFNSETVTYMDELGQPVTQSQVIANSLNNRIASRVTTQTNFVLNFTVPSYIKKLYVIRNELGLYSSTIVTLTNGKAKYDRTQYQGNWKGGTTDILYGVNGGGDLFTIDPISGSLTILSTFPDNTGSYTCAIDPVSEILYTVGRNKNLYAYDITNNTWSNKGNLGLSGPRLEFKKSEGLLYFSTNNKIYKVDPSNANVLGTYTLTGMTNYGGGDICFDAIGDTYLSSTDGLYKATFGANNTVSTSYISAQSLPNFPTSLTFDSSDELWWATIINNKGYLYIMDKVTGGFQSKFSPYTTGINDLATLPYDPLAIMQIDTDNDGVVDFYDEFPADATVATTSYTPSIYGWGTYAFEDLWPDQGDYDFNDLVVNYRYTNYENSAGLVARSKFSFKIKNVGGSYRNGLGIELTLGKNNIQSITGHRITKSFISMDAKGLENNQSKVVMIAFDDAWDNFYLNDTINLFVEYTNPIHPDSIGDFNTFMFIDGERAREVHMAGFEPTDLCDATLFGTADDNTNPNQATYYKTPSNLPWGIDIIHDFVHPKEKKPIILGYSHFATWAQSGGYSVNDWYKEKSGYRNNFYLNVNN